jgi:transcriptional regulator with GAF, ATPase, and Fis domain
VEGGCPVGDGSQRIAFESVSSAFASLGRVCLALDAGYRIRHLSPKIDDLLGSGTAKRFQGAPVENLLGAELFGPAGPMRQSLEAGELREGWRAWLGLGTPAARVVSVSAAPLLKLTGACDPSAVYLVILRPADADAATGGAAPTGYAGVIARSRAMLKVLRLVESLQHSDSTVLLTGESGVGKGVIAQAIHASSSRRAKPLVAVNCAALPETLLESELFGHVRGAFTGAVRDRVGRFEMAAGGTLFLDEIGDLPLHLQAKLLRVLQERTFERVGDSRPLTADVRIIAATHRDLRRGAHEGRFREDLFYRLRVFPIEIPRLRDRREDIEPLARHLVARVSARTGRALGFSPDALRVLLEYRWPGNVRELENALEYGATVARGQTLQPEDLPPEMLGTSEAAEVPASGVRVPSRDAVAAPTSSPETADIADGALLASRGAVPGRDQILAALNAYHWRTNGAARALGVSRTTLWRWMRKMQLTR